MIQKGISGFLAASIAVAACTFSGGVVRADDILVATQDQFRTAVEAARPGDTIVLEDGEWSDFEILFTGRGTAGQPITLTAETKGKVVITGQSNLRLAGQYLVVSGLVFRNGYSPTNTVIAFRRNGDELAYNSRVTEVVIDRFNNPERYESDFWVLMYGKHNRFDHNHLEGKSNQGVTMAVVLDSAESQENHHRIDHNYFGPRPVLGSNGGETLRIGTSHYSLSNSFTVVENNFFDRCDGEVEIISSKSGGNVFRGNLFFESRGTLTLRHGNGNVVENNVFLGNRVDHTGGIRVINKRQTVRNNYLQGLTGHRFGGALVIMNGVPDSPINRYHQVEDAVVENNTIADSDHIELAAGSDEERSAPPVRTAFRDNLVYNEHGEIVIAVHDDISGIEFEGNVTNGSLPPAIASGFWKASFDMEAAANGLLYPSGNTAGNAGVKRDLAVLDRDITGVSWYPKAPPRSRFDTGKSTRVAAGEDALFDAVRNAAPGDVILLEGGNYLVRKLLVISRPLTIRAAGPASKVYIEFERTALFEIADGGSLRLAGLTISGKSSPDAAGNTVVRTSRYSMLGNYELLVEDSSIEDLDTNHSFNFLTTSKHTFADRIAIARSSFRNISGDVLALDQENDDLGIYNAEYVDIDDSSFSGIDGAIANLYRGGTDESTFGPHFVLTGSTVTAVGAGKRNKADASINLAGVQAVTIRDNEFTDSRPVRLSRTVGEPQTDIAENRFVATPEPVFVGYEDL